MGTESEAEKAGYDCGLNGPNTTNCNFALFAKPNLTKAWERGAKRGKSDRDSEQVVMFASVI